MQKVTYSEIIEEIVTYFFSYKIAGFNNKIYFLESDKLSENFLRYIQTKMFLNQFLDIIK